MNGCVETTAEIRSDTITIKVPVVYMVRHEMVLRRARSITRGIEMGGPWKSRLLWALKATSEASAIWAQKKSNFSIF